MGVIGLQINEGAPISGVHTPYHPVDPPAAAAAADAATAPAAAAGDPRPSSNESKLAAWLAHAASSIHTPRWLATLSPRSRAAAAVGTLPSLFDGPPVEGGGPQGPPGAPGAPVEDTSPASSVRGKRPPPSGVDTSQPVPAGRHSVSPFQSHNLRGMPLADGGAPGGPPQ